jgi:hypothetical protein
MQTGVIAVMGTTGNTGKKITEALRARRCHAWTVGEQACRTEVRGRGSDCGGHEQRLASDESFSRRGRGLHAASDRSARD